MGPKSSFSGENPYVYTKSRFSQDHILKRSVVYRRLRSSDLRKIWTVDSFYGFLEIDPGVFENFDFCHNGGHFEFKMAAIMAKIKIFKNAWINF